MTTSNVNVCFNSNCKEAPTRKGWLRRTGEYAHLCDHCAAAYEEGRFCETFHLSASGWRCCESCGKQIHCGCIVSFHMFVLLDAGGVECLTCADKSFFLTPNPAWPPPTHVLPPQPERMKDLSVKSWSAIAGSGPVPWREAPSFFNESKFQSDRQARVPFEIDVSGCNEKFHICQRLPTASPETNKGSPFERLANGKLRLGPFETFQNGNAGPKKKEQLFSSLNDFQPIFVKNDSSSSNLSLPRASSSKTGIDDTNLSPILSRPTTVSIPVGKHVCSGNEMDSSCDFQIRIGKAQGDGRGQSQLLPRYHPKTTTQELQEISSDSKSCTIPLFEKMLSASDAGRIGRLVLPKKCAEAYFPPISQPEGLPLKVQDVKGKEWVFQFRFWPNNSSRMYVLEGITPCIQSMHLEAGDIVTFSRREPDGKLVMGCRKAPTVPPSIPRDEGDVIGSNASIFGEDSTRSKSKEVMSINCYRKGKPSSSIQLPNQAAKEETVSTWSETDNSGFTAKKRIGAKPFNHSKRKKSNLGMKSKYLEVENENLMELKLTWNEAQGLMRPPDKIVPSIFVVEGCEFEEFEATAPVIGRPTLLSIDHYREKAQWVQCEDCFKWRKAPVDALLPSRWTCSANVWDLDRSVCSAAEELTTEQLEDMLPVINSVSIRKEITEQDADPFVALQGLDALAKLAIQGKGEEGLPASSETRTKHPRHKPACTCIVCLQPPSGTGAKHKQSCDCVVCISLKRRFKTLMERREKKQIEKGAESASPNLQSLQLPAKMPNIEAYPGTKNSSKRPDCMSNDECPNEHYGKNNSASPLKGQIDLNVQPEREDELSPGSDSGPLKRSLPGGTERFFKQPGSLSAGVFGNLVEKQMPLDVMNGPSFVSWMPIDGFNQKTR